jgi:adenylate cyclase
MENERQASVLFADVSGSTKLYETAGDQVASAAIGRCVQLFIDEVKIAGGTVVKTVGDEVMAVFDDANQAASCAIEIQNGIDALAPVAGTKMGVRIGFHHGPVVEKDKDYFGDTVNLASRLAEVAIKGQVITSLATVTQLNTVLRGSCRQLFSIEVKGKAAEIEICEVVWKESDEATTLMATRPTPTSIATVLRLKYRDQEVVLDATRRSLTFGRDKGAELVIHEPNASRSHGKIEMRMGKFVLVDHSANGTFLSLDGDRREYVLRREEYALRGHGWFRLGQSRSVESAEVVEFFVE